MSVVQCQKCNYFKNYSKETSHLSHLHLWSNFKINNDTSSTVSVLPVEVKILLFWGQGGMVKNPKGQVFLAFAPLKFTSIINV